MLFINYIKDLIRKKLYAYFIDDILHELHLYEKFKEKIEARDEPLNNAEKTQLVLHYIDESRKSR